tara:strand:- start:165 stop:2069 length:1905 start_codon:yes stop_codon:yes gene_type:complete
MLKAIVNFLNLKLELLNYFDLTRCLCELKTKDSVIAPKEYIANGEFQNIDFDSSNGVSYWRLRDSITVSRESNPNKALKRVQTTVPMKLVFSVLREKLTADDAYSFDRIRQTIVKQFNIDNGALTTALGAAKVTITAPSSNGDPLSVWEEETSNTGTQEPDFKYVFGSIDIDIVIDSDTDCLPTECDDVDSDILHAFDFCNVAIQERLTVEQVDCLVAWLADCDDATVENSDASYSATVASGGTLVLPNTPISANGDLVINQPSTIAKDVVVRYATQGTVLTTIVSGEVIVPDVAAAGGTISVSTSNAAPSFLDSITLTATVTGITATGYILQYPDKFGNLVETASQLSNVFVVNAKNVGTDNYYIVASDGTNEIIGEVSVTTTVNIPIINGKKVISFWKLISAYAGSWVRVRRFSDNSELDIPYTNGRGDIAALRTFVGNTGFAVTIYYDQAANGNATQTTTANQPDLDGGGFVWMNASIRLVSAMTSGYSSGQTCTDHLVFRSFYPSASNQRVLSHLPSNKKAAIIGSYGANVVTILTPSLSTNSVALDIQKITQHTMEIKNNSMKYWADGVQVINDTSQIFTAQATTGMDYFCQTGSFSLTRGANFYAHVSYANDRIAAIDNILQELVIND